MKKTIYFNAAIVFCLCFFGLPFLAASADLTPHAFIAATANDLLAKSRKQMSLGLENAPADMPFIREVELRAGINEMDENQQTYQLRFIPRAFGETKYSRKLTETAGQAEEIDKNVYLCTALKERYLLVVEYIEAVGMIKSCEALEAVHIDRVNVLQHMSATEIDTDISALISTEDKLSEVRLKLMELKERLADHDAVINRLNESNARIAFDDASIISMEKIETILKTLTPRLEESNAYLEQSKYRTLLGQGELALEQAKGRDWLSFFQITYEADDEEDEWVRKTSIEIGIRLPILASGKEEIWRRKVDLQREKLEYEQEKIETLGESTKLLRDTINLLAQYRLLKEKSKNGSAVTTLNRYLSLKGADPLDLLRLKESILDNDIRMSELSLLIRSNYIELMELMGRLTRKPLTDYLSNNLERL